MSVIIESRGVSKSYSGHRAVKSVELQIQSGESVGILGPNGAGKTSLMKMMYGGSPVTEGLLYVLGTNIIEHPLEVKAQVGVVPQEDGLDPDFSVIQNLEISAHFFKLKKPKLMAKNILREFYLEDYENSPIDELSGGMKRRLVIARALLHKPKILFLDEPTTGLDPAARLWIWEKLLELKRQGVSLILTTHYMEEASTLCSRVLLMNQGQTVDDDSPKSLIEKNIGEEVVEFKLKPSEMEYYKNKVKQKYQFHVMGDRLKVFVSKNESTKDVLELVTSDSINVRKANLEDVFLKITGFELGEKV